MEGKPTLPTSIDLRNLVLHELTEPVLFRGLINDWSLLSWTLCEWANKIGNKPLPFRVGQEMRQRKTVTKEPLWEGNCPVISLTMKQFIKQADHPSSGHCDWLYFAYKHMNEWFQNNPEIVEAVSWKNLGFPEQTGADSTLWIGSKGAHTPCHFDTYGCNLVAQIFGRKQWVLVPPEETTSMSPTRVPYEESSVYSSLNFTFPDSKMLSGPMIKNARVITLNPGDVLFLPHHWWHYVENLDTAISINTWIPLPQDNKCRLEESLVRLIFAQVARGLPASTFKDFLSPFDIDLMDSPICSLTELVDLMYRRRKESSEEKENHTVKKIKFDLPHCLKHDDKSPQQNLPSQSLVDLVKKYEGFLYTIPKCSHAELIDVLMRKTPSCGRSSAKEDDTRPDVDIALEPKERTQDDVDYTVKQVLNAFCHPDVIELVAKKLQM